MADHQAALNKYLDEKDYLFDGRTPPQSQEGLAVGQLANHSLTFKKGRVESGELEQRSWDDYRVICDRVVEVFGENQVVADLRPHDFDKLRKAFAKTHGLVTLHNDIKRSRVVFNYAHKQGLIDRAAMYGMAFDKPDKVKLRGARQEKGKRKLSRKTCVS